MVIAEVGVPIAEWGTAIENSMMKIILDEKIIPHLKFRIPK
jgi:hypothetical protein